ncbi:MAG: peroxide stress protein YaaA, partial [Saezia sp.]
QAWSPEFTAENSKQALLAFDGDVYAGLNAPALSEKDLLWAQDHLIMLSGLYGVLRPLDWLQAYRLEMGTKLPNPKGKDLYAFWKNTITPELNKRLQQDKTPVVINLASQEYFKSVDLSVLKARVVECVFEDYFQKTGEYRIITFYAKRARGLMARYAIQNQIDLPHGLHGFDLEGYAYCETASQADRLVFRRRL